MSAVRFSVPGQPIRRIVDTDPELALTPRQRHYVTALRSVNWNRHRAARHLGIDVRTIQSSIADIRKAGYPVQPGAIRGPRLGAAHPPMEGEAMMDPDPLAVPEDRVVWPGNIVWTELEVEHVNDGSAHDRAMAWSKGFSAGYHEASERRRLAVQPFLWGVAFGAALTLIIALAVLR